MNRNTEQQSTKDGKWFFGWKNIAWFIREIGAMYSSKTSYFSKKRIESGVSFILGQIGMMFFLFYKYDTLTMTDFIMWASLEFAVGGFMTWQIQKQKKEAGYYSNSETSQNGSTDDKELTTDNPT